MKFLINKVIYLYLFICLALLLFDLLYILQKGYADRKREKRTERWRKELNDLGGVQNDGDIPEKHIRLLKKRLKKTAELEAYYKALFGEGMVWEKNWLDWYFTGCRKSFQILALDYQKKSAMDRAFFAYVVSVFSQYGERVQDRIPEILLSFLKNSTVYCREHVLQALYASGNVNALEQAFQYISENQWFHHERLIADGLQKFRGDKEMLVKKLWEYRNVWEEVLMIGIVQFAANVSDVFQEMFYQSLLNQDVTMEIQFALMRYFRHYPYAPAWEYLTGLMNMENIPDEYLIVAASVLDSYPGEKTKTVLKKALHHSNWYVRRNSAMSLWKLGMTEEDLEEIKRSDDRYACEMLAYTSGKEAA